MHGVQLGKCFCLHIEGHNSFTTLAEIPEESSRGNDRSFPLLALTNCISFDSFPSLSIEQSEDIDDISYSAMALRLVKTAKYHKMTFYSHRKAESFHFIHRSIFPAMETATSR